MDRPDADGLVVKHGPRMGTVASEYHEIGIYNAIDCNLVVQ